ncbi:hypothetical protein CPB84DRAFT_1726059 [Gymnopilus junonius]|uniref:F-box domain-containing protein n=1 Tax=Gymnopilus junonius TaxID=109634 RepID=A0A9P5NRV8_GYMJU|nr:hypothetical protein CPB84DRAFT_1726059 [Gymnopilus junonius]
MDSFSWHTLPTEMQLAIVDLLGEEDVKSLSQVDQRTYQACVPALFKKVKLDNFEAIENFLEHVPRAYCNHIEDLELCTVQKTTSTPVLPRVVADTLISLLSASPRLSKLVLRVLGSLDKSVLAPFPYLHNLKRLSICNCGDEVRTPLSERLVVSMALATRNLEELSLDHITRSKMHAPELEGVYPCPPLALNDEDIPDHPILGSELSLPSLLRIPTLRKLTIRDTHLGHEGWTTSPVACRLEFLDVGSCLHEDEDFNTRCTERIMAAVGPTVDEFSLTAAVSDTLFSKPSVTPLQRLRSLHITPFFPVDSVVDTMANLAGSPVEKISVQCFEDEVVDMCQALEDFLALRLEKGPQFYEKLKQINVSVTAATDDVDDLTSTQEEIDERLAAARRLQEFCRDLQLGSVVGKDSKKSSKIANAHIDGPSISFVDAKRYHTKNRSMTI